MMFINATEVRGRKISRVEVRRARNGLAVVRVQIKPWPWRLEGYSLLRLRCCFFHSKLQQKAFVVLVFSHETPLHKCVLLVRAFQWLFLAASLPFNRPNMMFRL